MRTVFWIGGVAGAVISVVAVALWLSTANAGDVIVPKTDTKVLTGAQKTALVNAAKCDYPALVASTVHSALCHVSRKPASKDAQGADIPASEMWQCELWSAAVSMTAAEFSIARANGDVGNYDPGSWNGSALTAKKRVVTITITAGCMSQWDAWIGSVFPGATMGLTTDITAARHVGTPTQIDVTRKGFVTQTAVEWLNAGGGQPDGPEPIAVAEQP